MSEGEDDPQEPAGLVSLGSYSTRRQGLEHCLVVLAMGIPCWLVPSEGRQSLMVEAVHGEDAAEQIRRYDRESANWPPAPLRALSTGGKPGMWLTPMLWALATVGVFAAQIHAPGRLEDAGALNGAAVLHRGEWWRPATALFLHANPGHLLSNLISGYFAFVATLFVFGVGRGWLLLAAAGIAANTAVAFAEAPTGAQSLGASTAIFGAIGLLAGRAFREVLRAPGARSWRQLAIPCAAGVTLLALYGAGGPETDVAAHGAGFIAGLVLGAVFAPNVA